MPLFVAPFSITIWGKYTLLSTKYLTDEGQPDIQKMGLITYEPVSHSYVALGETVGKAFSVGKKLF